jgi:hypothetical protein
MHEDTVSVSDNFFYRVMAVYCAAEHDVLRDAFEGMWGRPPQSDRELNDWLATDEGKQANTFATTTALRWGEVGRA